MLLIKPMIRYGLVSKVRPTTCPSLVVGHSKQVKSARSALFLCLKACPLAALTINCGFSPSSTNEPISSVARALLLVRRQLPERLNDVNDVWI